MRTALIVAMASLSIIQAADPPKKASPQNALAREVSPYLRQHASNPVQWYPWGSEALTRAKKEKKLIFLSIGYSSCHWCHVMERESFSNQDIAQTLNANFICIKVDREERPDIDEVYLSALQASGERGGWPLTMFLTHEAKPIFGGTYFPPEDRVVEGETIPGFKSILKRVLDLVEKDRKGLYDQADRLAELTSDTLDKNFRVMPLIKMDQDLVTDATIAFEFDPQWGGFGRKANAFRGSKFPRAAALRFLLSQSQNPGQEALAKNLRITLDQMAAGGIYDHLGGGFHRYSTERTWTVPHFEKMLYDNSQLVEVYSEAYRQRPNLADERVIRETLAFLEREMLTKQGLFCSALDADTNHREGEFYIWTADQLRNLGDAPSAKRFRDSYSLNEPNFEEKYFILRLSASWAELAKKYQTTEADLLREFAPLKQQLLDLRSKRQRPFRDDKALTGWNGLTIAAFAKAGQTLKEPKFVERAESTAKTLLVSCRDSSGRLARMSAGLPGEPPQPRGMAFLEDYAYLIHGLLNLHDATSKPEWLTEARRYADLMLKWYSDSDRGGFYTTSNDAEKLFTRSKEYYDGAYPSGNGMAAYVLARLYAKTQHRPYAAESEKTINQFLSVLKSNASATPMMALALSELLPK